MSSRDHLGIQSSALEAGDELDTLLCRAVQDLASNAEPAPHVWQRIEGKLGAGPSPVRHRSNRRAWRIGPSAQALALAGLLAVLGLNLEHRLPWSRFYDGDEQTAAITPSWSVVGDSEADSLGRESAIMGHEPGFLARTHMNAVSTSENDDLLSKRQVLQLAGERVDEGQSTARDASPGSEPVPRHRED